MNEDYTFHEAIRAIDLATITGRIFPRSFRDNHPISQLLCIDWRTDADRDAWLEYFGAKADGNVAWSSDWHGWRVLLTAHWSDVEDSGPVGAEQRDPNSVAGGENTRIPPAVTVTEDAHAWDAAEAKAAERESHADDDIDAAAARISGLRTHVDLERGAALASALLDPDATIEMPCIQSEAHEVHASHTRHVGAYGRFCLGYCWDAATMHLATVTR